MHDEDSFFNLPYSDDDEGDETYLERKAKSLYIAFTNELSNVTGDREAVGRIRETLRDNIDFIMLHAEIIALSEGKMDWINAIFRSEAKRAQRKHAGRMEEIRKEREARLASEKAAEAAELESMQNFGMF